MSKLLRANFSRLLKSTLYRSCMVAAAGMGIMFTLLRYFDIRLHPEYYVEMPDDFKCAEGFAFSAALHIVFIAAIFFGSYLGTEYSEGTIRNKILAGHKRYKIYISNLISASAASILLMLTEMFFMFAAGKLVFTVSVMNIWEILIYSLIQCISMVAFTSILVLFMMLISNKAASSVAILIITIVMFMAAFWSKDTLDEPQYIGEYAADEADNSDAEPVIVWETWENPRYVSGFKRDMYEFIYDFLPTCQLLQIAFNIDEGIPVMIFYSVLICCSATGLGIAVFNKKDLK